MLETNILIEMLGIKWKEERETSDAVM